MSEICPYVSLLRSLLFPTTIGGAAAVAELCTFLMPRVRRVGGGDVTLSRMMIRNYQRERGVIKIRGRERAFFDKWSFGRARPSLPLSVPFSFVINPVSHTRERPRPRAVMLGVVIEWAKC